MCSRYFLQNTHNNFPSQTLSWRIAQTILWKVKGCEFVAETSFFFYALITQWLLCVSSKYLNICVSVIYIINVFVFNEIVLSITFQEILRQQYVTMHAMGHVQSVYGPAASISKKKIDQTHNLQNAPVPYLTMHHSKQKCAHFCSEWCIVVYGSHALWDLWDWSIQTLTTTNRIKACSSSARVKCRVLFN